jgi:RHS repeat-associated protein
VNLNGSTVTTYDYDAFGNALDFDATTALTPWLFGGDGQYDPSTGFTYQLARWRDGDVFTSTDSIDVSPGDTANANLFLYGGANPISNIDPSGHDGLLDVLTVAGINAFLFGFTLSLGANLLGTAYAYNHPVSGATSDPGGEWIAVANGFSIGLGLGSVGGQLQTYEALGSNAVVSGVSIGFSINLPGRQTVGDYLKDLAWYSRSLYTALSVPGLSISAGRELVAASLRGWTQQVGGDLRLNSGFSGALAFGGGAVFGAPFASYLPGFFIGAQGGVNSQIGAANFGAGGDYLQGFSLHDGNFTSAKEADASFSLGFGGGSGVGIQLAGSFFIPINFPGWYNYI